MTAFLVQTAILSVTLLSILLFLLLIFVGWLLRTKTDLKIGFFYTFFCFLLSVYIWCYFAYSNEYFGGSNMETFFKWFLAIVIFTGVWVVARILLTLFWDIYLIKYRRMQVPALLRNLAMVLILIVTILLIVRFVFLQSLSGLLVASSITAAVIAFALQDFLGALIAGIALNIHPPFQVGDWIYVLDTEGKVMDVNWRATTLYTTDKNYVVIPNSTISGEKITNYQLPGKHHAMRITVSVEFETPPTLVKETLIDCALKSEGVELKPEPRCRLTNFGESSITYELKFYIKNHANHEPIRNKVTSKIWYMFTRLNINMPFPQQEIFLHKDTERKGKKKEKQTQNKQKLRNITLFKPLDDEQIQSLFDTGEIWTFGKDEQIVEQNEKGDSLYLILEGRAEALIDMDDKQSVRVGQLKAGDFFGEKSLFYGKPRGATIRAATDIEVMEIEKKDMKPILKNTPGLINKLSDLLAERQMINEGFYEEAKKENEVNKIRKDYSSRFLDGMKSFFGL